MRKLSFSFPGAAEGSYIIRVTAVDTGTHSEFADSLDLVSQDLDSTGNV